MEIQDIQPLFLNLKNKLQNSDPSININAEFCINKDEIKLLLKGSSNSIIAVPILEGNDFKIVFVNGKNCIPGGGPGGDPAPVVIKKNGTN